MKWPRINKHVLKTISRLYVKFGAYLLIFIIAFQIQAVRDAIVVPFTSLVAGACKILMNIFGAEASIDKCVLSTPDNSINIVDGCNGIYATAILISGVLAYPSSLKQKLCGVLLGTIAVFIMNLGRVISLFYLGQHFPDIFEETHVYVWQPIIIIWAIFVWDFWARRTEKDAKVA